MYTSVMDLMSIMAEGNIRLKGRELLERYDKTLYRVAKDGGVPYSTLHRWVSTPEEVRAMSGDILLGFLRGLGLTIAEINALRFEDVFEVCEESAPTT